jgi:RHS repeat-associated protein
LGRSEYRNLFLGERSLRVLPGQYFDAETGTHYNYFRDYDPTLGRYIESDPAGLRGGTNTYGYVDQRPLITFDPYGLVSFGDIFNPGNWWGKLPGNIAGKASLDELGRIAGRTCSTKCQELNNPRMTRDDITTEICNRLIPEQFSRGTAQGNAIFFKCKEVCTDLANISCSKRTGCGIFDFAFGGFGNGF